MDPKTIDEIDPIEASLEMANFWVERHTEKNIIEMLRVEPHPDWDEYDLKAYKIIRKALELALAMKRAKTG